MMSKPFTGLPKLPAENTEPWPAPPQQIAQEYFPDASPGQLEEIIWGLTGFPWFWHIGVDGNTPLQCFHTQLRKAQDLINKGMDIGEQLYEAWDKPMAEIKERIKVRAYYLWEAAGRPEGRSDEFYYAAKKAIMGT
jgi:hypothetical protein